MQMDTKIGLRLGLGSSINVHIVLNSFFVFGFAFCQSKKRHISTTFNKSKIQ